MTARTQPKLKRFFYVVLMVPGLICAQSRIPINIESDDTVTTSIVGFKQDLIIEGTVEKGVIGYGCTVHLKGVIKGNLVALGGEVIFYHGATVKGNLVCLGGYLQGGEIAEQSGANVIHYFEPGSKPKEASTIQARVAAYFAQTLVLFLLVILTFYVFPNQINEAGFELSGDLVRPLIIGAVTQAVFFLALVFSIMLIGIGIGILLFILFFCAMAAVNFFGVIVIFYRLGQYVESLTKNRLSLVTGILIAILLVWLLLYISVVGTLVAMAILLFGSGVIIDTRFGTNKSWFTRKPRYWSAG